MFRFTHFAALAALLVFSKLASAQSTASQYGQCGGIGWSGATLCPSGWSCNKVNDYYFQCLPGGSGPTTTPGGGSTGGGGTTPTTTASGGSATLQPGWSWIRAVVDPNFHKYLASSTPSTASPAVLGSPANAAQFKITNGQLIQSISGGKTLYAVVEPKPSDPSVKKLAVSWSETAPSSGTFKASGDTIEWSDPAVSRSQNNAWLVCPDAAGNRLLFVNLGPYSYQTPAGCADQTIHYYTGTTADP
ncbi:carbohydrate-binding module family 1 protein [Pterulicium gracile]|uniref:Carbohydrate-binding module family 1 protein n=1 Tax=Pterulicium gracile TaxID=1884261 RepID=A0A5C3QUD4_9AGAR|nr:carbohydrate-binding module family 1 protein [Pterula gracilis]